MAAALWVLVAIQAPGITWDFDDPAQGRGWVAVESRKNGASTASREYLSTDADTGVLRIVVPTHHEDRIPSAELISPRIGGEEIPVYRLGGNILVYALTRDGSLAQRMVAE